MTLTPWPRDGRRDEQWQLQIIQPDGQPGDMLPVDPEVPGRVSWSGAQSPIGATFTVHGTPPPLAGGQLVQPVYSFRSDDLDVEYRFPALSVQGVEPLYDVGEWFDLSLIDQTIDYAGDGIDFPLVMDAGTVIMDAAAAVLQASIPGRAFTLPDTDLTLRNLLEFRTTTDPLLIFNTLMEAAGCTQLSPVAPLLGEGLVSRHWTAPNKRPIRMRFGPGDGAGFLPEVRTKSDYLNTPNVAHYETPGGANADPLVGRWRDEDPLSMWSIPTRGKRVFAKPGRGEAATQLIADQHAMRIGTDHPGRGRTATIRGGFQPLVAGDIIQTVHPDHPDLSATWEVVDCDTATSLGSETTWSLKEVTP